MFQRNPLSIDSHREEKKEDVNLELLSNRDNNVPLFSDFQREVSDVLSEQPVRF